MVVGGVGVGTLLGPEGPGAGIAFWVVCVTGTSGLLLSSSPVGGGAEGFRPYFENYTVDASILKSSSLSGFGFENDRRFLLELAHVISSL